MRILYLTPYPPARDGIGDYTAALAGAVRARGHDTCVVVPRPLDGAPAEVAGALSWRPDRDPALTQAIARFAPDVVHVQFAVAAYGLRTGALIRWIAALRASLGVPVVVTMHEVTRDTGLLRAPGRALYRRLARRSDTIIVHTQAARLALAGLGVPDGKVEVIPHPATRPPAAGAEPAVLRERFGLAGARILLSFGFVHVDKGLDDLVRALGRLRRSAALPLDDVRVVVAGAVRRRTGPLRVFEARDHLHLRAVLRLARRYGVRENLVLTGYVPQGDVTGWFRAAEAVVLPYRRIEQSGVAGIAAALGAPVLASRVGGLDEQFGGSPWMFPPRDPARLAAVLTAFLADPGADRAGPRRAAADLGQTSAATVAAYADLAGAAGLAGTEGLARVG